jgi:hypothetical protein
MSVQVKAPDSNNGTVWMLPRGAALVSKKRGAGIARSGANENLKSRRLHHYSA